MPADGPQGDLHVVSKHHEPPANGIYHECRDRLCDLEQIPGISSVPSSFISDATILFRKITQRSVSHISWQDVA